MIPLHVCLHKDKCLAIVCKQNTALQVEKSDAAQLPCEWKPWLLRLAIVAMLLGSIASWDANGK